MRFFPSYKSSYEMHGSVNGVPGSVEKPVGLLVRLLIYNHVVLNNPMFLFQYLTKLMGTVTVLVNCKIHAFIYKKNSAD